MILDLAYYKGRYEGRVAILCGGTTAGEQALDRVACPILGVNESWRAMPWPRTFAHVLSDWRGALVHGPHIVQTWPQMPLFQKAFDPKNLVPGTIPIWKRDGEFRFDIENGAWTMGAPVLALQLVVYMGFTEVIFIGLDLKQRGQAIHWWGDDPSAGYRRQEAAHNWRLQSTALRSCAKTLHTHAPHARVLNVSHDTACDAFEIKAFDEVFA